MEAAHGFAEEIDFQDLFFEEIVDRGAFGVVRRAQWKGKVVAVKLIETDTEKKAFFTELKQLSRVNHLNIVGLYGACTTPPVTMPVCLVMEYAEGGSLYNVLHGARFVDQLNYTVAHGMSWALQTARGVEYLHNMKPKPLIHRDLKPPNLLLVQGGTVLKICDFGTACDAHTHMTNNKGSAAWMAPEVFEGSNYSEKCDVFSFGIILWEILTRRKPFDEIGGPAFRIMWAVHNGTRPPLIKNCPKPVEVLMCKCWSANPVERPSMAEICRVMSVLFQLFKGADEPIQYPSAQETEYTPPGTMGTPRPHGAYANPPTGGSQISSVGTPTHETVKRAISEMGEPVQVFQPPQRTATPPVVVEEENPRRTSAPASLAASRESLLDGKGSRSSTPNIDLSNKRFSADLSKLDEAAGIQGTPAPQPGFVRGHRRACSHGTPFVVPSNQLSPHWAPSQPVKGHRRSGSHGNAPTFSAADIAAYTGVPHVTSTAVPTSFHHSITAPGNLGSMCAEPNPSAWTPGHPVNITSHLFSSGSENAALTMAIAAMDHQLQPLAPCATCPESVAIFQQHIQYAQEYLRVQAEIALLNQRKHELQRELQAEEKEKENSNKMAEEYKQIISENESLMLLHHNLTKQVEPIRKQRQRAV